MKRVVFTLLALVLAIGLTPFDLMSTAFGQDDSSRDAARRRAKRRQAAAEAAGRGSGSGSVATTTGTSTEPDSGGNDGGRNIDTNTTDPEVRCGEPDNSSQLSSSNSNNTGDTTTTNENPPEPVWRCPLCGKEFREAGQCDNPACNGASLVESERSEPPPSNPDGSNTDGDAPVSDPNNPDATGTGTGEATDSPPTEGSSS